MQPIITLKVKEAKNVFAGIAGLIGKKKPESLFLHTRLGIHTFIMSFPIDLVILNNKSVVVDYKENLKPWRVFFWNPLYKNVLELPGGIIRKKGIKKGTRIKINVEQK